MSVTIDGKKFFLQTSIHLVILCLKLSLIPMLKQSTCRNCVYKHKPLYWRPILILSVKQSDNTSLKSLNTRSAFLSKFAVAEVLLYIIEPRIPCNDVFSKCWIVESNPVGAWVLLKLYISSNPILTIHCSLWTNHSLSPHKTCNYHHHPCSTQQLFYEVEIICFSAIFITQ